MRFVQLSRLAIIKARLLRSQLLSPSRRCSPIADSQSIAAIHTTNSLNFTRKSPFGHLRDSKWTPKSPLQDVGVAILVIPLYYFAFDWNSFFYSIPDILKEAFKGFDLKEALIILFIKPPPRVGNKPLNEDEQPDKKDK